MTLFSIIIATYNAEKTIRRCLFSLLKQSVTDFEAWIIDGKSTDRTLEYIAEFDTLPVHMISEPDKGLYDAINKGIAHASGQLIVILGADDELTPNALSIVRSERENHPADIYVGQALMIEEKMERVLYVDPCDFRTLVGHIPFCHNAMYANRTVYSAIGNYDLSYKVSADAQWIHRAIRAGVHFHAVETPLVRFYAGGISGNAELTMPECYRLIQENFPCLDETEAKALLFMSKGWEDGSQLETILARHPDEAGLARAAYAAREYAQYCAQRKLDKSRLAQISLWKKVCRTVGRIFK